MDSTADLVIEIDWDNSRATKDNIELSKDDLTTLSECFQIKESKENPEEIKASVALGINN